MAKQDRRPGEDQLGEDSQDARHLPSGPDTADELQWDRVIKVLSDVRSVWAVPVLRALDSGVSRPRDLLRAVNARARPGRPLSPKIMHETLELLVKNELVRRTEIPGFPLETHYRPTPKGKATLTDVKRIGAPEPGRWPVMGHEDGPAPAGNDTTRPTVARAWNVLNDGKDNYAADREAMRPVLAEMPSLAQAAKLARRFQNAAIRRLVTEQGVRQFLDIGTGLPLTGAPAVHETAQRLAPECRVVYVDNDRMVATHARALLTSSQEGACDFVAADLREPGTILARAAETLDLERPVAVVLQMILHFLADEDDPWGIVRRLMQGISGSRYLVIGHAGSDIAPGPAAAAAAKYNETSPMPLRLRSHEEIARFFTEAGLEMLEPGLVPLARWWPQEDLPQDANAHVGIGWRSA